MLAQFELNLSELNSFGKSGPSLFNFRETSLVKGAFSACPLARSI